ncbi:branched-chain amino acid ABC transporter permease [Arenibaculum pallidiluteum]|uniref:branched-chain amino acid ABC transporter permease n=1 Tax=Arenibaculum pallidiluteum TaxID=2812559 RepID=UPI001A97A437|nr:branched-chain amino acid ABC transporter permease [Arenibaculum pallidiluteum]
MRDVMLSGRLATRGGGAVRNAVHLLALVFLLLAIAFGVIAWAAGDTFYLRLATEALIFAGLAMSVDILLGYTGLLSLGQALYFGLGAYTSAVVLRDIGPSFWLAMGMTLVLATLAGTLGGFIANRVKGVYFALITFGLAQVVAKVVYNTRELGASDGLIGVPEITIPLGLFTVEAANPAAFFLFVLAFVLLLYAGIAYLMDTPFGRTLTAIRANDRRVPFLGSNPLVYRMLAYVLAANVAALTGALYPMLRGFVSPELMFFHTSGNAVITVIVGGVGTLIGPILGSVLLTALRSVVGTWTEHHLIVIGVLFMLSVILLPKGLIGAIRPWLQHRLTGSETPR